MSRKRSHSSPSWEVTFLLAQHLDPKTLAIASCVSKSWYTLMSSDSLWKLLCSSHYPSLFNLKEVTDQVVPYRQLCGIGYTASKLQNHTPSKPKLSLDDLVFIIDARTNDNSHLFTTAKVCNEIEVDKNGSFQFKIDVNHEFPLKIDVSKGLKITWNVLLKEWKAVFKMMECEEKVNLVSSVGEGLFSGKLPVSLCCHSTIQSGIVAELKVGFSEIDDKVIVNKLNASMLNTVDWRLVSLDDGLRYLDHFLLPCDA